MKTEPVALTTIITSIVTAVIALLVSFNITVSEDQKAAIVGAIIAVGAGINFVWARSKVVPVAKAEILVDRAHAAGTRNLAKPKV